MESVAFYTYSSAFLAVSSPGTHFVFHTNFPTFNADFLAGHAITQLPRVSNGSCGLPLPHGFCPSCRKTYTLKPSILHVGLTGEKAGFRLLQFPPQIHRMIEAAQRMGPVAFGELNAQLLGRAAPVDP